MSKKNPTDVEIDLRKWALDRALELLHPRGCIGGEMPSDEDLLATAKKFNDFVLELKVK